MLEAYLYCEWPDTCMGGDLAPSWGAEKLSQTKFSNDLFLKEIAILTPKISDDFFSVSAV